MDKKNKVNKKSKVTLRVRKKFSNALRGIIIAFKEESTLIIYMIMTMFTIGFAIWLRFNLVEWAILVTMIGMLFGFEFLNTAIENFVDLLSFEYNIRAKKIKDICAAASIINAFMSIVVGFLLYLPKFIDKIQSMVN